MRCGHPRSGHFRPRRFYLPPSCNGHRGNVKGSVLAPPPTSLLSKGDMFCQAFPVAQKDSDRICNEALPRRPKAFQGSARALECVLIRAGWKGSASLYSVWAFRSGWRGTSLSRRSLKGYRRILGRPSGHGPQLKRLERISNGGLSCLMRMLRREFGRNHG